MLALWLTRLGVRIQIIDRLAEAGTTSRALAVQGRTLEFYQQIGLAQAVMARCHKVPALNLWVKSAPSARVAIGTMGLGLTPYPNPVIFPQDEHERLLIERLREAGVEVERMLELTGFADDGKGLLRLYAGADPRRRASMPTLPAATARAPKCARYWVRAFPEEHTTICFMSRMSKPPGRR